jgi:hypothetical protein
MTDLKLDGGSVLVWRLKRSAAVCYGQQYELWSGNFIERKVLLF